MESHGFKKGDKLLVKCDLYSFYVTYLGYSELDWDCFIGEDETGYVSDSWRWMDVVTQDDVH